MKCPYGGIGRRDGFKIRFSSESFSSNLNRGTPKLNVSKGFRRFLLL